MQHLRSPFTVCETIMQPLHSLFGVSEMTMQALHSLFTVCNSDHTPRGSVWQAFLSGFAGR